MRFVFILCLALAGPIFSTSATAATLAASNSRSCFGFNDVSQSADNATVVAGGGGFTNNGSNLCSNRGSAAAGGGYAGVAAFASATSFGSTATSSVYARAAWSDTFSVTAPANWTGGAIDVQVVFSLDASAFANSPTNDTDNASAFADFELLLSAESSRAGTDIWNARYTDNWMWTEYGPEAPRSLTQFFTTSKLQVVPGQDVISIGVDFDVTAFANAPDGKFEVDFDGLKTASLSKTGPAFILPDGFSVTNERANVFDNYWIDPRAPPVSQVPVPAGLPLLLTAFGGLVAMRRRWF